MIASKYCVNCDCRTVHEKNNVSHVLHLILSLVTFGLWVIVWVFVVVQNSSVPWICRDCGHQKTIVNDFSVAHPGEESPAQPMPAWRRIAFWVVVGYGLLVLLALAASKTA